MTQPLLEVGSLGPSVRELQKLLGMVPTGVFDNETDDAVRSFQGREGLTIDGLVGPATWAALHSNTAAPSGPLPGGPLVLPLLGDKPYAVVTSPFGVRVHPVTGEKGTFHSGIDLRAKTGTTCVAVVSGIVKRVDRGHKVNGNAVFLKGSDGRLYCYLHLDEASVVPGQALVVGQRLGASGNTGRSTAEHLHFTVYGADGNKVDPAELYPSDWLLSKHDMLPVRGA